MTRQRSLTLLAAIGLALLFAPGLWAQRGSDQGEMRKRGQAPRGDETRELRRDTEGVRARESPVETPRVGQRSPTVREPLRVRPPAPKAPPPGHVLDSRHGHDHYYPPTGFEVAVLPSFHRVIVYRNEKYYFHDGIWYRPLGPRFVVVLPPVGVIVPVLPPFYTVIWVGAIPYYYAAGVYYTWYPAYHAYVVTEPPPAQEVRAGDAGTDQLFVYPKQGQSEEQQADDRYECHRWASEQTGFDPTQPSGKVTFDQYASKRADYMRAMKACLEARGYSVQ